VGGGVRLFRGADGRGGEKKGGRGGVRKRENKAWGKRFKKGKWEGLCRKWSPNRKSLARAGVNRKSFFR